MKAIIQKSGIKEYVSGDETKIEEIGSKSKDAKEVLFEYYSLYKESRKRFVENGEGIENLFNNYRTFLVLDWENIVLELLKKKKSTVFNFFVKLEQNDILPEKLVECHAFQEYQKIIADRTVLKSMFDGNPKFKIALAKEAAGDWKNLEDGGKSFYILSIECATYVRSSDSNETINVLAVSENIVLTDGVVFKGALPSDEIVYLEV